MGGGGGGTTAAEQDPNQAKKDLGKFYKFQGNQENQYVNQSPLLSRAEGGAGSFWDQLFGGMPSVWNPSAQEQRDVSQQSRAIGAAQGTAHDVGQVGREVLAQDQYRIGRAGQLSGLVTGGLNQLLGVEGGSVSDFTTLNNPVLGFLSNILSGNQQARIANAQIGAQQSAQSKSGTSGAIGGGLSAAGSIAGIAL